MDSAGLTATVSGTIQVLHVGQPPVIPPLSGHVALIGQPFQLTIPATDADAQAHLTYTATGLPLGASLNASTGVLTWTPTALQAGESDLIVTVSAGQAFSSQGLRLVASAHPIPPERKLVALTPSLARRSLASRSSFTWLPRASRTSRR